MATREDELAKLKCLVLDSMRSTLVKDVNPTKFLPYLRSKFVVDAYESDMIKNCCSKSVFEGADKLIDVLCTKGDKGYDEFCLAILHEETQIHLLRALNKRLEWFKHAKKQQQETLTQSAQEATALQGNSHVRPCNPLPSYGRTHTNRGMPSSAHTTSCMGYVSPPAPVGQQHFGPDFMRSRSPCDQPNVGYDMNSVDNVWRGMGWQPDDNPCGQPVQP